jgi:hypothetical protein
MLFSDFETAVAVHFHTERIDGASVTLSISAGEIHICKWKPKKWNEIRRG